MTADHCLNCGHHLAHHSPRRGECNYFPPDDLFCPCEVYEDPNDDTLGRVRALLEEWETSEPGTPLLAVMGLRRVLDDKR